MRIREINVIKEELNDVDNILNNTNRLLKKYPNDNGLKGDLFLFENRKNQLLKELKISESNLMITSADEEINIHISGKSIKNHSIPSKVLIKFIQSFEDVTSYIAAVLEFGVDKIEKSIDNNFINDMGFNIKPFSQGSFMITFSPKIFEDGQTVFKNSLNKKAFYKLCELIECDVDSDKIRKQLDIIGISSIIKYKQFIKLISDNELDLTMTEGNEIMSNVNIKHGKALNIYRELVRFGEDTHNSEIITLKGLLYYINTDRKTCGIKFYDYDIEKDKKISHIIFNENLKTKVKNNVDSEVEVSLEKIVKISFSENKKTIKYHLIDFIG